MSAYDTFGKAAIDEREQDIIEFAVAEWSANPQPDTAPVPPLSLSGQAAVPEDTSDAVPVDDGNRETFVSTFQQAPSAEWVNTALDIFRELVCELELRVDDPRLVASFGGGDGMSVSINNRYVFNANFSGTPRYGLLVNRVAVERDDLTAQASRDSTFNALPGEADDATPYFLRFERGIERELAGSLRDGWLTGAATELDRASGSPYKNSNRPILYRAAMDTAFREQLLEETFD